MAKPKKQPIDLVEIDLARFEEARRLYFKWKDLNSSLRSVTTRGLNFPEGISEQLGCYALGYKWNKGSYGDARSDDGLVIEMKASSNFNKDLTSFSPKEQYDNLVFLRLNYDENHLFIYDLGIGSDELSIIPVNATQTVADQQLQGRRPRLSLIKKYIEPNNVAPTVILDITNGRLI